MDTKVFKQAVRAVGVGQWAWHACVWLVEGWQRKKRKRSLVITLMKNGSFCD